MDLKEKILNQAQTALDAQNAFQLFLPKTDYVDDHGFKFIIRYCDCSLLDVVPKYPKNENPLLPPFDTDIHVCDLNEGAHHHLLINKFMQCKGHIVLSAMEEDAEQGSNLNISDFCAFEQIFTSFNNEGMLYYNSGINSACTQMHKHIQYTPIKDLPILDAMAEDQKLPIIYHVKKIEGQITSEKMMSAYQELLEIAKDDPPHDSYNFIVSNVFAFYIPRKKPRYKCGTMMNSFAISGNYSFWKWSDPAFVNEPLSVLEDVCFSTRESNS